MSLLTGASVEQLKTLLDLYPVDCLREQWVDIEGTKDEICLAVAGKRNLPEIFEFAHVNFGICKQNIYVYRNKSGIEKALNLNIPGFELMHQTTDNNVSKTFLVRYQVEIILRAPLDEVKIDFILPIKLDFTEKHFIVRFVKFERNFSLLFRARNPVVPRQGEKEKAFLSIIRAAALQSGLEIQSEDLNKGVKTLWANEFMDASKLKFKTDESTDTKEMHDHKGLRTISPESYDKIKDQKLLLTLFETKSTDKNPPILLTVDPSKGYVSFGRFTERKGDSDYVVREILRHNE